MRDSPGRFLLNFDGLPALLSLMREGENIRDGDENVAQRLHSHSGIHAFNKSEEGEGRREAVEGRGEEKKVERVQPVV